MSNRIAISILPLAFLFACSPSREDVQQELQSVETSNRATFADKTCGFPTFGLKDVRVDSFQIDGNSAGSAIVSGVATDGAKKGVACSGSVSFHYVKSRSTTQGVNGESVSYGATIIDLERTGDGTTH